MIQMVPTPLAVSKNLFYNLAYVLLFGMTIRIIMQITNIVNKLRRLFFVFLDIDKHVILSNFQLYFDKQFIFRIGGSGINFESNSCHSLDTV